MLFKPVMFSTVYYRIHQEDSGDVPEVVTELKGCV